MDGNTQANPEEQHFFNAAGDDFNGSDIEATNEPRPATDKSVQWQASEFIHHDKSFGWYAGLFASAVVFGGLAYAFTRDVVSLIVVLVAAIVLAAYASRPPRQLDYVIDSRGLSIGPKHHSFDEFRSFSIAPEGAFLSVVLMPLRRFAATTTVYFAPNDQEDIVNILSAVLPFEEYKPDAVDKFVKAIRF